MSYFVMLFLEVFNGVELKAGQNPTPYRTLLHPAKPAVENWVAVIIRGVTPAASLLI